MVIFSQPICFCQAQAKPHLQPCWPELSLISNSSNTPSWISNIIIPETLSLQYNMFPTKFIVQIIWQSDSALAQPRAASPSIPLSQIIQGKPQQKQQLVLIQAWGEKDNILVNYFIILFDVKINVNQGILWSDPGPLNLAMLTINFYSNTAYRYSTPATLPPTQPPTHPPAWEGLFLG